MAAEIGRIALDGRLRMLTAVERARIIERMNHDARVLVWAQADRAGVTEPLALTRFLLERLYPELRGERLDSIMERFAELAAAGRWSGPRRPDPLPDDHR